MKRALLLAALALANRPTVSVAESSPASPARVSAENAAAVASRIGTPIDKLVLVGRSGQIYKPLGSLAWKRTASGGVGVDVIGAIALPGDEMFAIGNRAPVFRHSRGLWSVTPLPNRGRTRLIKTRRITALTLGRHLYFYGRSGFSRSDPARGSITAVWADSRSSVVVANSRIELLRKSGKKWIPITHPLDPADRVIGLYRTKGVLWAFARSGAVLHVGSRARPARLPTGVAGVELSAAAVQKDGTVLIVARTLATLGGTAAAPALYLLRGSNMEPAGTPPALVGDDRYQLAYVDSDGAILLASRAGKVFVKRIGADWQAGALSPHDTKTPTLPAGVAPARTR